MSTIKTRLAALEARAGASMRKIIIWSDHDGKAEAEAAKARAEHPGAQIVIVSWKKPGSGATWDPTPVGRYDA